MYYLSLQQTVKIILLNDGIQTGNLFEQTYTNTRTITITITITHIHVCLQRHGSNNRIIVLLVYAICWERTKYSITYHWYTDFNSSQWKSVMNMNETYT